MLALDSRLHPNDQECASKVIDGEAVIINLSNGTYYGMDRVGSAIREMVSDGHSMGEMIAALAARCDVTTDRAERDVRRLADELLAEKLVLVMPAPRDRAVPSARPVPTNRRLPYAEPTMPGLADIVWSEADDDPPRTT